MNKNKIMAFADGSKEIFEGMVVAVTNGDSGKHLRVSTIEVTKVGREFVSLGSRGLKYNLVTGREKTDYVSGRIYSSMDAYNEYKKQESVINKVQSYLRNCQLSFEQAKQIATALKIQIEE
jgi:hypothetical protein